MEVAGANAKGRFIAAEREVISEAAPERDIGNADASQVAVGFRIRRFGLDRQVSYWIEAQRTTAAASFLEGEYIVEPAVPAEAGDLESSCRLGPCRGCSGSVLRQNESTNSITDPGFQGLGGLPRSKYRIGGQDP
jgi:hypothetical protein